ncbi:hypothetical protein HYW20_02100 [Candidatus Woesearchaeota archaeon]|nr:hypothetical protein [Candidatus Woesearchaeota archaeon]
MDKEAKNFEIQSKIIELKLERDKDTFITSMSIVVGVIAFMYTIGFIPNDISQWIKDFFNNLLPLPFVRANLWIILALIFVLLLIPILSGIIASYIFRLILKNKSKLYDTAIKDFQKLSKEPIKK